MTLNPPRPCGRGLEARRLVPKPNVKFKNKTAWRRYDDKRMRNRRAAKRRNLKAYRPELLPPAVRTGAVEAYRLKPLRMAIKGAVVPTLYLESDALTATQEEIQRTLPTGQTATSARLCVSSVQEESEPIG